MIELSDQIQEKKFIPFSMILDIRTIEDARAMYFIFNYLPILVGVFKADRQGLNNAATIRSYILNRVPDGSHVGSSFDTIRSSFIKEVFPDVRPIEVTTGVRGTSEVASRVHRIADNALSAIKEEMNKL